MAQHQELKRKQDTVQQTAKYDAPPPLSIELPKKSDLPNKTEPWSDDTLPVDILLVTVDDCEFLACYAYMRNVFKSYHRDLGFVYFGNMGESEEPLKVALMRCLEDSSGPGGAVIVVKNAVMQLRPKAVYSVGCCKGLNPENTKLGDVVISSKITTETFKIPVGRDITNLIRNAADGWNPPLKSAEAQEVQVHCDSEILSGLDVDSAKQCRVSLSEAIAAESQGKDALNRVKEMIVAAPVLAYYDVCKPVVIQCDASQTGLGAALLQEGRPVAYSSRVMTPTEQNYAQIEKELLAIVFACEKFDQYIFGRSDVVVQSDHKPLETIFKKPIHTSPKRLQRMRLRLQNYDLQVEYKKGTTMFLADTLSRAYVEGEQLRKVPNSDVRSIKERLFAFELEQIKHDEELTVSPTRLKKLREETAKDEELQILSDVICEGWPETLAQARKYDRRRKQVIELYWNSRDELTTEDGLVYKGHRLVIPAGERPDIVKSLHESHIGVEGTLRRARDIVYWPGITVQLKDYLSKCGICNSYRPEQCKQPLQPHEVPNLPWEKVGVDLFMLERQVFLIAVDYYSGYFEVQDLSHSTSDRVITVLKTWFARHGIPVTVISDNGPPFNSGDFKSFSKEWDFHHITSSPYHAQSNGRVENAVKSCKSLLMKARADKRDPLLALLEWRNTPTEGMHAAPTQLLYGRRTRTRLPVAKTLLEPNVITNVPEKIKLRKQKQKHYYDQHTQELPKLDDADAIRMRLPGEKEWSLGQVIGDVGNRSYVVEVNGKHYRRNRRWSRATPEETSEPTELTEQTELPTEFPQPLVPSTPIVPAPPSRPTREHHPPQWLKDYEC